jgi:hypothetical protein
MQGKLKKLTNTPTEKVDNMMKFYPQVVNKTNIVFSNDELILHNKGLNYN